MSDNGEAAEDEPVVELGDGDAVDGAPVARVASRLFFPIEKSEVVRREGETAVRTPDGAQSVADVLDRSEEVYFETSHDFVAAVRSVVGAKPVGTASASGDSGAEATDSATDTDDAKDTNDAKDTDDAAAEDDAAADDDGGFEFDDN
jgi:hypothetical protein